MGERLSTMSLAELQEARKDLISKLKQINEEISNRMERESRTLSSEARNSLSTGSSSSTTVKKIKKKVSIATAEPASTKPVKKASTASAASSTSASSTASASSSTPKTDNIKATIADMKAVLDDSGIVYSSTAKKDELISLVRANYLIRKAEYRCQQRKKASGGASAENSD
jgi:hypothetical protein